MAKGMHAGAGVSEAEERGARQATGDDLAWLLLTGLTLMPLAMLLVPTDHPLEVLIVRSVTLGLGAVLPWRYVIQNRYRWWALVLGVVYGGLTLTWLILPLIA